MKKVVILGSLKSLIEMEENKKKRGFFAFTRWI